MVSKNKKSRKTNESFNIYKHMSDVSSKNHFINPKQIAKIGSGIKSFIDSKKTFKKLNDNLKKLETGKTIHTSKIVEDSKLKEIKDSAYFAKYIKNGGKKNKPFSLHEYLMDDPNNLIKNNFKKTYNAGRGKSRIKNEIIDHFNKVMDKKSDFEYHFNDPEKKSTFYSLLAFVYITALHNFIPNLTDEANKYLEIIADNLQDKSSVIRESNVLKTSLPITQRSSHYGQQPSMIQQPSMVQQPPLSGISQYNTQPPPSSIYNSPPISYANDPLLPRPPNVSEYAVGGSLDQPRNVIDMHINKILERVSFGRRDDSKVSLKKAGLLLKKVFPGVTYSSSGIHHLKANKVNYSVGILEEIINKIYHCLRESRKYLNVFLIQSHFFEGISKDVNGSKKSNLLISNISDINSIVDDELIKAVQERVINHYFADSNIPTTNRYNVGSMMETYPSQLRSPSLALSV
jgi:hypothetical protein